MIRKPFPQTCTTKAGKKFTDPKPFASWKTYASKTGKYSLKYPESWAADICDPAATDLILYLGPTKASSVICGSEHASQIQFISTTAVPTAHEQALDPSYYSDQTSKKVVVDGVSGTRQSGKLKVPLPGPVETTAGTLVVRYFFLTPGRSYLSAYIQSPSGDYSQDNLAEFDAMMQKTLDFTK